MDLTTLRRRIERAGPEFRLNTLRRASLRNFEARRGLMPFTLATKPDYEPAWFQHVIAEHLDRVLRHAMGMDGGISRLAISIAPQHGKSELVSRRLPALAHGIAPDLRIIATSYNDNLASFNAAEVRKIHASPEYRHLFGRRQAPAANEHVAEKLAINRANYFEIPGHQGYYLSAGIRGTMTGFGFDLGIIDDPIKNEDEADSEAFKRQLRNAWHGTFESRERGPHSAIVMVFTRWRQDDLMGYVMDLNPEPWTVLTFPAIQDLDGEIRPDYDCRDVGEGLWLDRYGQKYYEEKRSRTPPRTWSGMYQQRPSPGEGGMFKRTWFRWYMPSDIADGFDQVFQMWDMGFKKTGRSWVVGMVVGVRGQDFFVLDRYREHVGFNDSQQAVKAMSSKWPEAYTKGIEDKANGPAIMESLHETVGGFVPVPADISKVARAAAATPVYMAGHIHLPRDKQWSDEIIDEHADFPLSPFDDQVDTLVHAVNWYRANGGNWLAALNKR